MGSTPSLTQGFVNSLHEDTWKSFLSPIVQVVSIKKTGGTAGPNGVTQERHRFLLLLF